MPKYKEVKWHNRTNQGYEVLTSSNGVTYYTVDGVFHREDGPAAIWPDGHKAWFLNGKKVSKEDFTIEMIKRMDASELFTIEELIKLRLKFRE